MRLLACCVAAALAAALAAPALAEPIPPAVAAMLDAAAADPAQLKVVAEIAKKTNPASVAEIDAKLVAYSAARAVEQQAKLASQGFFEGWTGNGELGGFVSSGNTSNRGAAVGVTLGKETRRWKHDLRGLVDYQQDNGTTSRERWFAGYEGNYKFSERAFIVATLSWERDRFSGFSRRFSEGLGLGYKLLAGPKVALAVDGGPALRQTAFTNGATDNAFALRAGLNGKVQFNPNLALTETATFYYDSFNTSVLSLTALTARLSGALSARASFQLNRESNPPAGRKAADTVSRFTIVYAF
jgi:putative salt-induced outer membrane protein